MAYFRNLKRSLHSYSFWVNIAVSVLSILLLPAARVHCTDNRRLVDSAETLNLNLSDFKFEPQKIFSVTINISHLFILRNVSISLCNKGICDISIAEVENLSINLMKRADNLFGYRLKFPESNNTEIYKLPNKLPNKLPDKLPVIKVCEQTKNNFKTQNYSDVLSDYRTFVFRGTLVVGGKTVPNDAVFAIEGNLTGGAVARKITKRDKIMLYATTDTNIPSSGIPLILR